MNKSTKQIYIQLCENKAKPNYFRKKKIFEDYRIILKRNFIKFQNDKTIKVYIVFNDLSKMYELYIKYDNIHIYKQSKIMSNYEKYLKYDDLAIYEIIQKLQKLQSKIVK